MPGAGCRVPGAGCRVLSVTNTCADLISALMSFGCRRRRRPRSCQHDGGLVTCGSSCGWRDVKRLETHAPWELHPLYNVSPRRGVRISRTRVCGVDRATRMYGSREMHVKSACKLCMNPHTGRHQRHLVLYFALAAQSSDYNLVQHV